MAEYYVPAGDSETEFTEKRSRFIGRVWRVESEEEAREKIAQTKAATTTPGTTAGATSSGRGTSPLLRRRGAPGHRGPAHAGGLSPGRGGERLLRGHPVFRRGAPGHRGPPPGLHPLGQGRPGRRRHRRGPPVGAHGGGVPLPLPGTGEGGGGRRPGDPGGDRVRRPGAHPALLPVEQWPAYAARITELTGGKVAAEHLGETFSPPPSPEGGKKAEIHKSLCKWQESSLSFV